jgi:hypothetical protein
MQKLLGQVFVFIFPSDRVGQLYPQAPGSLFVAFYVSLGYAGSVLTCLHMALMQMLYAKQTRLDILMSSNARTLE